MRKSRNPNNTEKTRQCCDCHIVYELSAKYFWKNSLNNLGFAYQCKACTNKRKIEWHFKIKYGLSMVEVEQRKALQQYKCSICKHKADILCVDHDKRTGKVREMLCKKCNQGLGLFDENAEYLNSAILYLEKYNSSKSARRTIQSENLF